MDNLPPSTELLYPQDYTNQNADKCACRGRGTFDICIPPPFTAKYWDPADPIDYQIAYIRYGCVWHSAAAREKIHYPDGWTIKLLTEWCRTKYVPLPDWAIRKPSYTLGTVQQALYWDSQTFATYGTIEPDTLLTSPHVYNYLDKYFSKPGKLIPNPNSITYSYNGEEIGYEALQDIMAYPKGKNTVETLLYKGKK